MKDDVDKAVNTLQKMNTHDVVFACEDIYFKDKYINTVKIIKLLLLRAECWENKYCYK